jgi:hypothetical protein
MRIHNDEAIGEAERDCLRFEAIATQMARLACTCEPPFTLGLHGDWGSGKTSLLHLVRQKLYTEARGTPITAVFFEAWRHQFEPQPAVALLQTLGDHFSIERDVWEKGAETLKVGFYTGLRLLSDLTTGIASLGTLPKGSVETLREEHARAQASNFSMPLTSRAFRETFENAISSLVVDKHGKNGDKGRLVILVDDLDRCGDEAVVRLLEAIKLYLTAKNCVFIIAADRRAIVSAVARTLYKDAPDGELRAASYCGKLFQAIKEVPYLADPGTYLERLLRDPKQPAAALDAKATALVALERKHQFLPPNPRYIKRFLSELTLRLEMIPAYDLDLLVAVQSLQTFHPTLYRVLEANPTYFKQVLNFCDGKKPVDPEKHIDGRLTLPALQLVSAEGEDPVWESRHLDPADGAVLRCAGLLRSLVHVDESAVRVHLQLPGRPA